MLHVGNASLEVCTQIVDVLRRAGINVAWNVHVKLVLHRDLFEWHKPRISIHVDLVAEGVDDLVDVLRAEAVFVAVFHETL